MDFTMDFKEIKIETPEFNENVKSVKNPFGVGFITQEQPEHTPDSYAIKTETPEILIECPSNIKSEISENISNEIDPLEIKDESHDCKTFGSAKNLQSHIKSVHKDVKNHKCETCGKAFNLLESLKTHILSFHGGVKNHKCDTCNKAFTTSQRLQIHISEVHEGTKNCKCKACGKAFFLAKDLKRHIRSVHERVKNHKCEICGKDFSRARYIKKHISSVHEGAKNVWSKCGTKKLLFNCPRCNFFTNIEQEFKDHMQTGHPIKSDLFKRFMK